MISVERVVVGALETNCYILDLNSQVLVIDPGAEFNKIQEAIGDREIIGCIITHYHFDHIGALDNFDKVYDMHNLTEGKNIVGPFTFEVIYTPGHKEDAITVYFSKSKMMFVGDFLFKGGIGRTDLKGGSITSMRNSLKKINLYNNDIIIYPGHGDSSILGVELKNIQSYFPF